MSTNHNIKKIAKSLLLLFVLLSLAFVSCIYVSTWIPENLIQKNVISSCRTISQNMSKGGVINIPGAPAGFTDGIMVNVASVQNTENSMLSTLQGRLQLIEGDPATAADACIKYHEGNKDNLQPWYYARYWHGYILPLKVSLMIFDYCELLCVGAIIYSILFAVLVFMSYKKLGGGVAICFTISQLLFLTPVSVFSLTNPVCYYIAYTASIILLLLPNKYINNLHFTTLFFFSIGGITCYLDFLRTPILCLGIPLTYLLLIKNKQQFLPSVKSHIALLSMIGIWLLGYVSLWAVKWGILYFAGIDPGGTHPIDSIVWRMFNSVFSSKYLLRSICILASTGAYFVCCILYIRYIKRKHPRRLMMSIALLLIAGLAPIWASLALNHTVEHARFVHRIYSLTTFCLLLLIPRVQHSISSSNESK